jgi:hypothetical protein
MHAAKKKKKKSNPRQQTVFVTYDRSSGGGRRKPSSDAPFKRPPRRAPRRFNRIDHHCARVYKQCQVPAAAWWLFLLIHVWMDRALLAVGGGERCVGKKKKSERGRRRAPQEHEFDRRATHEVVLLCVCVVCVCVCVCCCCCSLSPTCPRNHLRPASQLRVHLHAIRKEHSSPVPTWLTTQ